VGNLRRRWPHTIPVNVTAEMRERINAEADRRGVSYAAMYREVLASGMRAMGLVEEAKGNG